MKPLFEIYTLVVALFLCYYSRYMTTTSCPSQTLTALTTSVNNFLRYNHRLGPHSLGKVGLSLSNVTEKVAFSYLWVSIQPCRLQALTNESSVSGQALGQLPTVAAIRLRMDVREGFRSLENADLLYVYKPSSPVTTPSFL